jgi:hypothetical protein
MAFAHSLNIELCFLPTYSPNLNLNFSSLAEYIVSDRCVTGGHS